MYHCHLIRHCRHNDDKPSDFAVLHVQSNPCRWFLLHRKMLGLHIQLWCQPAPNLFEDSISNFWDWSFITCGMCCFFSPGSVIKRLKSNLSVSDAPPFYDTNNWVETTEFCGLGAVFAGTWDRKNGHRRSPVGPTSQLVTPDSPVHWKQLGGLKKMWPAAGLLSCTWRNVGSMSPRVASIMDTFDLDSA